MNDRRPEGGRGSAFLIDGNNFLFRAYHALPMLNAPDGTPVNAVHGLVRMVQALRRDYEPELICAVFDAGGPNFRKEIYPEYKANRAPTPDDLIPQIGLAREGMRAIGIPVVEQRGVEADDIIASFARRAHEAGHRVVIVSSDKDLMQLVEDEEERPSVLLLDTMKNRVVGPNEVAERWGVPPALLGDLLALAGDSSDNIPGVPGIGPKTAAGLLEQFGDLEGVLAGAEGVKQKKRRERLLEHAEDARVSRRLVELRADLELPVALDELRDPGLDVATARAFFEPLGFATVLRELGAPAPKVARGEQARDVRTSEEAIELGRIGDFTPDAAAYRVLLDGEDALVDYLARLRDADRVAFHLATSSPDAMRSVIVGIGLVGTGLEAVYVPIGHRGLDPRLSGQIAEARVLELLRPLLEDPGVAKVAHGHKLACTVLARFGVEVRGVRIDPMLASYTLDPARTRHDLEPLCDDLLGHRLPGEESVVGKGRKQIGFDQVDVDHAGAFVAERVDAVRALGAALEDEVERTGATVGRLLYELEMPLATVLRRIEMRGILLDVDAVERQSRELGAQVDALRARIEEEAGHPVNPDSPPQLQKLLFEERGLPPGRKTKTGYSTDAKVLEELSMLDPIVNDILEYRMLTKLKGTYLDPLPGLVNPDTGRLHTNFRQAVAATGRLSSTDPNLQNIPVRTEVGRRIREAFVAPPGRRLVTLDYSQIELRILAHLSQDPNLCSAFVDDVDVHTRTAAEVFGVAEDEVTGEQRRIAKAVNFGVIYGQTAFGLAQQLGIPRGRAGSYIKTYFEKIPGVDRYMQQLITEAKRRGYAETLLGRKRRIPELRRKGPARGHGERIARNTPIQGSAADILKLAMIAVEHELESRPWGEMLLTVHDELIFECDEDRVDELVDLARPLMEHAFELSVPTRVGAGSGRTWAEAKG